MEIPFILCHGSGNRFAMIDTIAHPLAESMLSDTARRLSRALRTDGLLLLVRNAEGLYGMRMFNPDGSEAEMCGNGIRCVARLARHYLQQPEFTLTSGGIPYRIRTEDPIFESLPTFSVEIPIRMHAPRDFAFDFPAGGFLGTPIPALDAELRFTALNPGNPHIVAATADMPDLRRLTQLGERVLRLTDLFPRGVNVSLFHPLSNQAIHVATYERGAGITDSCGTAMTASSTAACLLGYCLFDRPIEVYNRGGKVRCRCRMEAGRPVTTLSGNATFEASGTALLDGASARIELHERFTAETEAYARFEKSAAAARA